MPKNIGVNLLIHSGMEHITEADADRLSHHRVREGDVVVGRKGDLRRRAYITRHEDRWFCGTDCIRIRPNSAVVNPRFLSYYFGLGKVGDWLHRYDTGSTLPSLNTKNLSLLPVITPPLAEQRAIAEVLGTLDDKIEVNKRLHGLCHDLASTLLARVLDIAESNGTLEKGRLGDVAQVNARKVTPGGGMLRYLDISAVGVGRADDPIVMEWVAAPGRARRAVKDGDVLWSTVRPNRRSHSLVLDPEPDLVVSTGFAVLTPVSIGPSFLYGVTERSEFVDYLVSVAEGSAYPAVRAERFSEALVPLPSQSTLASFEELTMPLRRYAGAALNESRELAALRDTLLPPLLSGELRLRDAKALVGEAV